MECYPSVRSGVNSSQRKRGSLGERAPLSTSFVRLHPAAVAIARRGTGGDPYDYRS